MKKIFLFLLITISLVSCVLRKIKESRPEMNKNEIFDGFLFYPKQGQIYLSNIEDMVGEYVVVGYDIVGNDTNSYTKVIGRAITENLKGNIRKFDLSSQSPPYSSRITGDFSSDLSFAVGNLKLNAKYVYDVILNMNNSANIPKEFKYIDETQFGNIYSHLPQNFLALYFITGIEYRTLSYKEYIESSGDASISLTAIKVGGKLYYSNEKINSIPVIYFTGIDESIRFGDLIQNTNLYNKKPSSPAALAVAQQPVPKLLFLDKTNRLHNMKLVKKARPRL